MIKQKEKNKDFFPYENIRGVQDILIKAVNHAVTSGHNLIAHAPTGLGKTAASISPALKKAVESGKTVFFLTSMHTQHLIALETVEIINEKYNEKIICVDIVGKKHMCLQEGVDNMSTKDFAEYCKMLREDKRCDYYSKLKSGEEQSFESKTATSELINKSPCSTHKVINTSKKHGLCPYEVSMNIGKKSNIIVTDYYYLFHPKIRDSFLRKTNKELEDAIIIVDEAHNLPTRITDLASQRLTSISLKRAMSEAQEIKANNLFVSLREIQGILSDYSKKKEEIYIERNDFVDRVDKITNYEELIEDLEEAADEIRKEKKQSYLGAIASFLNEWLNNDEGYTRIFSIVKGFKEDILVLNYKCLDPSIIAKQVLPFAHSTILMSGTLNPTNMYLDILGFEKNRTEELVLKNPFPENNKINMIVPKTSTKYATRNEEQYKEIGETVTKMINNIPGNSAVFFPSFKLRDSAYTYMKDCNKTIFLEHSGMAKHEKEELLENFKKYKDEGAALLGVITGSFGEGIDLPGDYLKGVIIVGLPLQKPDLETKALIDYYDKKFGKGWDYGYLFPAFNKTLQSAGRCIRSETDKGVIIFLDERYSWNNYYRCFPITWNIKQTMMYENEIKKFFEKHE
ncbi:ATP-dependent DNA helicase [Candidatus Woesearchaeota archaeon]|nr:ATP-dependent DNA helicase [Candidatus Woesearchaeota archaeon]